MDSKGKYHKILTVENFRKTIQPEINSTYYFL